MNYRKYHGSRVAWTMSALPCKSVSSSQGLSWKRGKTTIAESGSPPWIQETQPVYKTKASVMDIDISLNEIPEEHVYVRSISGCLRSETGTCQNVCCIVWNIVYRCLLNVTSCASCAVNSGSFNFHGVIFDFLFYFFESIIPSLDWTIDRYYVTRYYSVYLDDVYFRPHFFRVRALKSCKSRWWIYNWKIFLYILL